MKSRGLAGNTLRRAVKVQWLASRTLRARLIAGLLLLFAVASIGVGLVTTIAFRDFQIRQLDQQLFGAAQALSTAIEGSRFENAPLGPAGCPGGASGDDGRALTNGQAVGTYAARFKGGQLSYSCEIVDTNGRISLSAVPLSGPRNPQAYSRHLSGLGEYRLTAFSGRDQDIHVAGLPLTSVDATVTRLEMIEIIVFAAALLLIGMVGTGWIRLSLRPLSRITSTAAKVAELPLAS